MIGEKMYKQVEKEWGKEVWIVNLPKYCGKFLYVDKGKHCSLHKHSKDETLYIQKGVLDVKLGKKKFLVRKGDSFRVKPNTYHQFKAIEDTIIIEFSTRHSDKDVLRKTREW